MSSSLVTPEDAASTGTLSQSGDGRAKLAADSEKQNKTPRHPPPRAKSASLLTQALATNYEEDEDAATPTALYQSPIDFESTHRDLSHQNSRSGRDDQYNGLSAGENRDIEEDNMAAAVASLAGNIRITGLQESRSAAPNLNDLDSLLYGPRDFISSSSKARGTSLERTDKEKRVESPVEGLVSTNPGDTGMSGHVTPQSPVTPDISTNPPTDGMRARYRSWRDRPPIAERAWSIGQHGSDDSGQVENSIKEALAGVEPNSRSRKASHSMRFFKEGLPEDKLKRKESKTRAQSKDGSSQVRGSGIDSDKVQVDQDFPKNFPKQSKSTPSPLPLERNEEATPDRTSTDHATRVDAPQPGYFDIPTGHSDDNELKSLPVQLLEDIRKNHNLTPGANKGTSFSRSIPVTASEKSLPDLASDLPATELNIEPSHSEDDQEAPQNKTDEDEDSGEEHIFSAVFLPHQAAHDSHEAEDEVPDSPARPNRQRPEKLEPTDTQQWLEEHEVPTWEDGEKQPEQETRTRALPSPKLVKSPVPKSEKDAYFPEAQARSESEKAPKDFTFQTKGDGFVAIDDQESDTTPTGSLKLPGRVAPGIFKVHDHQQEQKKPLEAIELIPYRHQVGGHTTMWRFSKRAVCKQLNNRENEFYEKVERFHPKLLKFLPRYIGVLNVSFEKQRRKATKREEGDTKDLNDPSHSNLANSKPAPADISVIPNSQNGSSRVISQSLQSASVPIPTVNFADNRHIIPKSLLRPFGDFQNRSKSDSEAPMPRSARPATPHLDGESKSCNEVTDSSSDSIGTPIRPTLEDKHSDSWGSTMVNKDLRNKVFDEVFSGKPKPIQHNRKSASQRRTAMGGKSAALRASNSDSSLKPRPQTSDGSLSQPPVEESMRRKALKFATELRKSDLPGATSSSGIKKDEINGDEPIDDDDKTGKSAPEYDSKLSEDNTKGKHKRRYSSGGLRRKPTEVAEDRGNLQYFEEADDAKYDGDGDDNDGGEVFAMDLEASDTRAKSLDYSEHLKNHVLDLKTNGTLAESKVAPASMLPAARFTAEDPSTTLEINQPVNPKEAQTEQGSRVVYFLLLEDLTAGMKKPCIMDLKMGTRQYGVDATEKKQKSQRQKCEATTSRELGVRVCGLQVWDVKTQTYIFQDKYFGRDLKAGKEFRQALQRFLYDGVDYSSVLRHIPVILKKLAELEVMIRTLKGYRFYAASLLMFYDGDTAEEGESDSAATEKDAGIKRKDIDFKIADFANCVTKEDHPEDRLCPPRHADEPDRGFLRGLRNLRKYFREIQKDIERRELAKTQDVFQGEKIDEYDDYDDMGAVSF